MNKYIVLDIVLLISSMLLGYVIDTMFYLLLSNSLIVSNIFDIEVIAKIRLVNMIFFIVLIVYFFIDVIHQFELKIRNK